MSRPGSVLACALLAGLLSAGATRDLVVVLPESNGHVGAVVVQAGESRTVLNSAYAAGRPGSGKVRPATLDAARVNRAFGDALAALPQPPVSFTLYFPEGSSVIDPASRETLDRVFAEVRRRKAAEIVITGHTDTVGADESNDALSKQRADAIRQLLTPILAERGVPPGAVSTAGRGRRELAEPEPDQTPDPKNRRVEITVR